jgi:hypothetical protein
LIAEGTAPPLQVTLAAALCLRAIVAYRRDTLISRGHRAALHVGAAEATHSARSTGSAADSRIDRRIPPIRRCTQLDTLSVVELGSRGQ